MPLDAYVCCVNSSRAGTGTAGEVEFPAFHGWFVPWGSGKWVDAVFGHGSCSALVLIQMLSRMVDN